MRNLQHFVTFAGRHLTKGQIAMSAARFISVTRNLSLREGAKQTGVNRERIRQADAVLQFAPELADEVMSGASALRLQVCAGHESCETAKNQEAPMPAITITFVAPGQGRHPYLFAWEGGLDTVIKLAAAVGEGAPRGEEMADPAVRRAALAVIAALALQQPASDRSGVIGDYLDLYDIEVVITSDPTRGLADMTVNATPRDAIEGQRTGPP